MGIDTDYQGPNDCSNAKCAQSALREPSSCRLARSRRSRAQLLTVRPSFSAALR